VSGLDIRKLGLFHDSRLLAFSENKIASKKQVIIGAKSAALENKAISNKYDRHGKSISSIPNIGTIKERPHKKVLRKAQVFILFYTEVRGDIARHEWMGRLRFGNFPAIFQSSWF
jgi:hypothetical protein